MVEPFWTAFYNLSSSQKESARRAWQIFKENPFDPRLRTHEIHRLSALYGRTIYAVDIEVIRASILLQLPFDQDDIFRPDGGNAFSAQVDRTIHRFINFGTFWKSFCEWASRFCGEMKLRCSARFLRVCRK